MSKMTNKVQAASEAVKQSMPKRSVDELISEFNRLSADEGQNLWELEAIIVAVEGELGSWLKEKFYKGVGLEAKGSTVRKFKKCGEAHTRFEPYKDKIPIAWTTRYPLATMSDADFDKVATSGVLHRHVPWSEIQKFMSVSPKKRKPKLNVLFDVYKVKEIGRQREFVRRLKELADEFNVELTAPQDSNALAELVKGLENATEKKAA
jgi:hypothetical protein